MEVNHENREVYVGVRPEGFIVNKDGALSCELQSVEVMGRDSSIVSKNANAETPVIRSIVDSDIKIDTEEKTVRFDLKANKVFVFDRETEERIYLDLKGE